MAKMLFLQNYWYESPAVMALSASLKQGGHKAVLGIGNNISDFERVLREELPDIVGFSLMSGLHRWGIEITEHIRGMNLPKKPYIIYGGPHPTFFPDILKESSADAICVGEGDYSVVELADCIEQGKGPESIENLFLKIDGGIKRNPLRALDHLDKLPVMDREIYYSHKYFERYPTKSIMTGRGCPFRCTFCYNSTVQELYRGKGSFVRFRTPEKIIEEILQVIGRYQCRTIYFMDDTLGINKKWVLQLMNLYKKEVGLPFVCKIRADTLDEEMVASFKEAGCRTAQFAIESANENIRTNVLKKRIKNEDILRTAGLLNKYKIKFLTYNMVGLPDETFEDIEDLMRLNGSIGTSYPWCSIFTPYPGTELAEYCIKNGYIDSNFHPDQLESTFHKVSIRMGRNSQRIENLHMLFGLGVKFPGLIPLIMGLSKLKPNFLFTSAFLFISFINYFKSEKLKISEAVMLGIRNLRINIGSKSRVKKSNIV